MARPIEPTPVLYGEDAEQLLESLEHCASPEEMKRRQEYAREALRELEETGQIVVTLKLRKQNCPFCHSHDYWVKHESETLFRVYCHGCGCNGPAAKSGDEARELWNKR